MTQRVTARLATFVAGHEGLVLNAYRDPAGVLTIGYGFTMRSAGFAAWAGSRWGRDLRAGDRLSRAEADAVLHRLLDGEYGPAVDRAMPPLAAHEFDGATSVVYNCGAATLGDRWGRALSSGRSAEAATLLRRTRITAGGRRLKGLELRRAAEARLIAEGDYGDHAARIGTAAAASVSSHPADIGAYQSDLRRLGFYGGAIDGIAGTLTDTAVRAFQAAQGLAADGVVGPATRASLARALQARRLAEATGAASLGGGAAGGVAHGGAGDIAGALPPILALGLAALAVAALAALAWHWRGALALNLTWFFRRFR